jgi:hypothetical protein
MKFRLLLAGLSVLWSIPAAAAKGEFYLQKTSFPRWEPVFLYYRLTNSGRHAVTVGSNFDPGEPSCSGHLITVSSDPIPTPSCSLLGEQATTIVAALTTEVIAPGRVLYRAISADL